MAVNFILCRRVDDHSVTAKIAESALPLWAGWEPVPAEPDEPMPPPHASPPPAPTADEPGPADETAADPTSRKSRSKAASTDSKE